MCYRCIKWTFVALLAGAKVLVGSSGTRHTPIEASLGSRTTPLPAFSGKRWHVVQMTAAEALAAAPDTLFKVRNQVTVKFKLACHCSKRTYCIALAHFCAMSDLQCDQQASLQ